MSIDRLEATLVGMIVLVISSVTVLLALESEVVADDDVVVLGAESGSALLLDVCVLLACADVDDALADVDDAAELLEAPVLR